MNTFPTVRSFWCVLAIAACFGIACGGQVEIPNYSDNPKNQFVGIETNGLLPIVMFAETKPEMVINIIFLATADFQKQSWLRITNRGCAKMRLWSGSGNIIPLQASSAIAAWKLPAQTTVKEVMSGVEWSRRGMQWWPGVLHETSAGESCTVTTFDLHELYGQISFQNTKLDIVPLVYKVTTNGSAHLIEFHPFHFKFGTNEFPTIAE